MNIINATPHDITVIKKGDTKVTFPKSGIIARVSSSYEELEAIDGFTMVHQTFGEIEGLPEETNETMYIVSAMVLSANRSRKDLIAPNTGATAIRDEKGHIVAVNGFVK